MAIVGLGWGMVLISVLYDYMDRHRYEQLRLHSRMYR